jgi:DNA-binding protein H-NS
MTGARRKMNSSYNLEEGFVGMSLDPSSHLDELRKKYLEEELSFTPDHIRGIYDILANGTVSQRDFFYRSIDALIILQNAASETEELISSYEKKYPNEGNNGNLLENLTQFYRTRELLFRLDQLNSKIDDTVGKGDTEVKSDGTSASIPEASFLTFTAGVKDPELAKQTGIAYELLLNGRNSLRVKVREDIEKYTRIREELSKKIEEQRAEQEAAAQAAAEEQRAEQRSEQEAAQKRRLEKRKNDNGSVPPPNRSIRRRPDPLNAPRVNSPSVNSTKRPILNIYGKRADVH